MKVEFAIYSGRKDPVLNLTEEDSRTIHDIISKLPSSSPVNWTSSLLGYRGIFLSEDSKNWFATIHHENVLLECDNKRKYFLDDNYLIESFLIDKCLKQELK